MKACVYVRHVMIISNDGCKSSFNKHMLSNRIAYRPIRLDN